MYAMINHVIKTSFHSSMAEQWPLKPTVTGSNPVGSTKKKESNKLPNFIIKPDAKIDFYVNWSTIVDAPTGSGTAAELRLSKERQDRADATGTSAFDGTGAWDDKGLIISEMGNCENFYWVKRENLAKLMNNLGDNVNDTQKALDKYCDLIDLD